MIEQIALPVMIVGIGNTLKGDDGIGPLVIERIKAARPGAAVIDCGMMPENCLRAISSHRGGSIVFVDAAEMNESAGTIRLFESESIALDGIMTHGISLGIIAQYIRNETGNQVYLLGIQPKSLKIGDSLSVEAEAAVSSAVEILLKVI